MSILNEHTLSRRSFLRQATCAALGATSVVNSLAYLRLTNAALAQSPLNDYKAMVCLFLAGGNDSHNLIIPAGTAASNPIRADYEAAWLGCADWHRHAVHSILNRGFRQALCLCKSIYGDASKCGEIAQLFNAGDLSFVCNVGTLVEPIVNRQAYGASQKPEFLGSHSDQQMQWQTSVMRNANGSSGWGGRVADLLHEAYNADSSKVSMSISLTGVNVFQQGLLSETLPFAVGAEGAESLIGFGPENAPYHDAYQSGASFVNPAYQNNRLGARLRGVDTLMRLTYDNLMEDTYAGISTNARAIEGTIGSAMNQADATGVNFDQIFSSADSVLGDRLKAIAKLIAGRSALGNNRQIFFISIGGYDSHTDHLASHANLLEELSTSMMAFRNALKAMGDWDKVLTFTASDFGRTLNANANAGTDHAWGGHSMVMGGPVNGGQLFGHFPLLKMGNFAGSLDATRRGNLIPSTSVDQYSAMLARWFGVESSAMDEIFPNLYRFDNPFSSAAANMQFISSF